jgi:hypothetical protein
MSEHTVRIVIVTEPDSRKLTTSDITPTFVTGEREQSGRHLITEVVSLSLLALTMLWLCLMLILGIILAFGACTI